MVPFWRRIALIVCRAALVTIASYVWSRTFITFGILHCRGGVGPRARSFAGARFAPGIAVIAPG
jgi:hypothetical protein